MKTIELGKHKLEIYESIKEMPLNRYIELQSYILQDLGIGSNIDDIQTHMANLNSHLANSRIEDAKLEAQNMFLNFYSMLSQLSFKCMSLGCLVKTIDSKDIGTSENELNKVKEIVSKHSTNEKLTSIVEEVKKNLTLN